MRNPSATVKHCRKLLGHWWRGKNMKLQKQLVATIGKKNKKTNKQGRLFLSSFIKIHRITTATLMFGQQEKPDYGWSRSDIWLPPRVNLLPVRTPWFPNWQLYIHFANYFHILVAYFLFMPFSALVAAGDRFKCDLHLKMPPMWGCGQDGIKIRMWEDGKYKELHVTLWAGLAKAKGKIEIRDFRR